MDCHTVEACKREAPEQEDEQPLLPVAKGVAGGGSHQQQANNHEHAPSSEPVRPSDEDAARDREEQVEADPDEVCGVEREQPERKQQNVEHGKIVGNLRDDEPVSGVAAQVLRPWVYMLREQVRSAPLEVLAAMEGVLNADLRGAEGQRDQQDQQRVRTQRRAGLPQVLCGRHTRTIGWPEAG